MNGIVFSLGQQPVSRMSRQLKPVSNTERYANWPLTAPLPLDSTAENDVHCATIVWQKLQSLWQGLGNRFKKQPSVTELMLLPLGSAHRKPAPSKASPIRFGAPRLYQAPQIPIPQRLTIEKKVAVVDDGNAVEHVLLQYGNLSDHGAFWLKNSIGLTMGTLRRERASRMLGNTEPKSFYALELDIPFAIRHAELGEAMEDYLLQEAMQQARKENLRLLINPKSAEDRARYKKLGFVTLEKALLRYVPQGQVNRPSRDMKGWLAYDGFLAGYPRERISSVKSL